MVRLNAFICGDMEEIKKHLLTESLNQIAPPVSNITSHVYDIHQ